MSFRVAPLLHRVARERWRLRSRFNAYVQKQRAIAKVVSKVLAVCAEESQLVLVVGHAVPRRNYRGYAPAPGIGLIRALSHHMVVILCDEAYSTKSCACASTDFDAATTHDVHYGKMIRRRQDGTVFKAKIRGMVHCRKHGSTLDRDINGALNIRKIFRYQVRNQTLDNPLRNFYRAAADAAAAAP
jgi:transposase